MCVKEPNPRSAPDLSSIWISACVLVAPCRREALRRWKSKQGLKIRATYGNLLELFAKAGHTQCAKALCDTLGKRSQKPETVEESFYDYI